MAGKIRRVKWRVETVSPEVAVLSAAFSGLVDDRDPNAMRVDTFFSVLERAFPPRMANQVRRRGDKDSGLESLSIAQAAASLILDVLVKGKRGLDHRSHIGAAILRMGELSAIGEGQRHAETIFQFRDAPPDARRIIYDVHLGMLGALVMANHDPEPPLPEGV